MRTGMPAIFPADILFIAADTVRDLQDTDALYTLWTVFTKCRESVQDSCRLENTSWLLWYHEIVQSQVAYQPPTPDSIIPRPKDDRSSPSYLPAPTHENSSPRFHVLSFGLPSPPGQPLSSPLLPPMLSPPALERVHRGRLAVCVRHLIVDMLPNHLSLSQPRPSVMPMAVPPTPPCTLQPFRSNADLQLVKLLMAANAPCPPVVNLTANPTSPTTLALSDDLLGVTQLPSMLLLTPSSHSSLQPKEIRKRPMLVKRSHLAKRAIIWKSLAQHRQSKASPPVNNSAAIQSRNVSLPHARPPFMPKGFTHGRVSGNAALNTNVTVNGNVDMACNMKSSANAQSHKTTFVANTSMDIEMTDGEDSDEWASEDMDAEDKTEGKETRLHEAALEAQHQRKLFTKLPRDLYSNRNRTQLGLLSQLMNPNPAIFLPNNPYWQTQSSAGISHQYQPSQHHAPARLSMSKSSAVSPIAAQITAISGLKPSFSAARKGLETGKSRYRPKGPPKEQEMEDDSGDDVGNKIQMPQSVAQRKLEVLMSRRRSHQSTSCQTLQSVATEATGTLSSTTVHIPSGHPYNFPIAGLPMTPKETCRRMLRAELSESMRQQLLWEHRVSSHENSALAARRANRALRLVTLMNSESMLDTPDMAQDERRRCAMAWNRSRANPNYRHTGQ